jgi:dephospho-CoA kinase
MAKIILGLAGEIASGKGTVSKYLVKKYDANVHRYSTMLRDVLKRLYIEENRENIQTVSSFIRQNWGEIIMSKVICEDIKKDKSNLVILDGVRRIPDLEFIEKLERFYLIYVEADIKKRYERIIIRGENIDDKEKTFEDFKADNQREAETQIKDLKKQANFVINNDGNLHDLFRQIDLIIKKVS